MKVLLHNIMNAHLITFSFTTHLLNDSQKFEHKVNVLEQE